MTVITLDVLDVTPEGAKEIGEDIEFPIAYIAGGAAACFVLVLAVILIIILLVYRKRRTER